MKTILFQGDSITDVERCRVNDEFVGSGYPVLVKSVLDYDYSGEYSFINRGVSGNRIVDLYARVKCDLINLNPNYVSILIGVNDVWHEIDYKNGFDTDNFEKIYSLLIENIKESLPDTKIMILEPFVLNYGSASSSSENPEKWECFYSQVRGKAEASRRISEKYGAEFVELQSVMEKEAQKRGVSAISIDGVHPTTLGHRIIADEWIKCFNKIKNEGKFI